MTVNNIGATGNSGADARPGDTGKTAVSVKTEAEFKELMQKVEDDKAAGKEPAKEDLQGLFQYTFRQSVLASGRQMQEAAKDIERDNIDKGF